MKKTTNRNSKGGATGAALGIVAAAAAAGAYWLYGAKDAAKHRKFAKSFMLKARADVMDAVERVKDIDQKTYVGIVDKVVAKYSSVAGVTKAEVDQMQKDLKAAWAHMKSVATTAKSTGESASRKGAKKVAKKRK